MKSVMILAAVAAVASAASYQPLSNPGTGQCVVIDEYDSSRDSYTLTLGDCSEAVNFSFQGNGKALQTDDGYCLSSLSNSGKKGNPVGLAACKSGKPGKQWTALSTSQWRNGYKLCLDYDSDSETMVQASCQSAPLPIGSTQQYTLGRNNKPSPPSPPPPPPPPAAQSCGSWAVKWGGSPNCCGNGMVYTGGSSMCAADGSNCRSVCCSYAPPPPPPPSTQTCGQFAVKFGGSPNCCGPNMVYTAGDSAKCAADNSNCQQICCSYVPPPVPPPPATQTCGQWSVKFGGSPNCCGNDMIYTAGDSDTCSADGSDCQSQCCSNRLY